MSTVRRPMFLIAAVAATLGCGLPVGLSVSLLAPGITPEAEAASGTGVVTVKTVPPVKGMRFKLGDRVIRADSRGQLRLHNDPGVLQRNLKVLKTRTGPHSYAAFSRFYPSGETLNATLAFYYRVKPRFINLQGKAVDSRHVSSLSIKGVHGATYKFRGTQERWVQGNRVVTATDIRAQRSKRRSARFRIKPLDYAITSAIVEGSNVVNAGQQRFLPGKAGNVRVRLLLYSAHFKTRDSFFGFPIGSGLKLTHPSGRVESYELEKGGQLALSSLPRGDYQVAVVGPGFSFTRPVSLSRNQEVDLEVLSYLDVGLVLFVIGAFVLGLPLLHRPHLLALILRMLDPRTLRRRVATLLAARGSFPGGNR